MIIVFSNKATLKIKTKTPVLYYSQLRKYLILQDKIIIIRDELEKIYNVITSVHQNDRKAFNEHVSTVRRKLDNQNDLISKNICPKCGGKLILRRGKYGQFIGCTNYPKCRFTTKQQTK